MGCVLLACRSSGGRFSFNDYDNDDDYSNVRAHLFDNDCSADHTSW